MRLRRLAGRFELLDCQETKTARPATRLANNNPANADRRFHDAYIACSSGPVKVGCVPAVTVFPGVGIILSSSLLRSSGRHAFVPIMGA
jgi:hypothetical protein